MVIVYSIALNCTYALESDNLESLRLLFGQQVIDIVSVFECVRMVEHFHIGFGSCSTYFRAGQPESLHWECGLLRHLH